MRKYIEIFKYSLKKKVTFLLNYIVSLIAFGIHVFIFNALWDYILQGKMIVGYTKAELIWYIIIAEMIIYTSDKKYKQVASMVKQGDIAYMLIKPINMVHFFLVEDFSLIIQAAINFVFALILGFIVAGPITISIESFGMMMIASIIGIVIGSLLQILIGIITFFTEENHSIYLIMQKMTFFVVFTPLEFYPKIVQKILLCLPTTYLVYTPAKIFANFEITLALKLLLAEIASAIVLYFVICILYKKGVEKINVNGG